jgi:putative effector of murein hydrolase
MAQSVTEVVALHVAQPVHGINGCCAVTLNAPGSVGTNLLCSARHSD